MVGRRIHRQSNTGCCVPPCEPQPQGIPTATLLGGGVDREQWITTGAEGNVLQSDRLKGKKLLYFNTETNDNWIFLSPPATPDERSLVFDPVAGTITLLYSFDPDTIAQALFGPQIN